LILDDHKFVKGCLLALVSTAIWSGNFIVARIIADKVPPVTAVVLRLVIAIIILLPFVIRPFRAEIDIIRRHLGYIALTAFLGLSVCNTVVYIAAASSPALNLSLIAISSPIFTLLFARLFLHDTLTIRRAIGLAAAILGIAILITGGQPGRLAHFTFSDGDLWMLSQSVSFALYNILVQKKPTQLHPMPYLMALFILATLLLLPWFAWEVSVTPKIQFTPAIVGAIMYLGVGPSLLAYLCWNKSVATIGPSQAAIVSYCLPLFSGAEALLFLGEPITAVHVLSGVMILGGVIFATREQ
jgi:drug/metabolite transporter (DMT)-like permease